MILFFIQLNNMILPTIFFAMSLISKRQRQTGQEETAMTETLKHSEDSSTFILQGQTKNAKITTFLIRHSSSLIRSRAMMDYGVIGSKSQKSISFSVNSSSCPFWTAPLSFPSLVLFALSLFPCLLIPNISLPNSPLLLCCPKATNYLKSQSLLLVVILLLALFF